LFWHYAQLTLPHHSKVFGWILKIVHFINT